jgi:hypothetical protein
LGALWDVLSEPVLAGKSGLKLDALAGKSVSSLVVALVPASVATSVTQLAKPMDLVWELALASQLATPLGPV